MGMQDVIAIGCVIAAGVFFLKKTVFASLGLNSGRKAASCGSGCGKCSNAGQPAEPLVSIGIGRTGTSSAK